MCDGSTIAWYTELRKGKISAEIFNPDGIMIETILKVVYDLK